MTDKHRVLLLGATGLTGHHCLALLLQEARVGQVNVLTRRPISQTHDKLHGYVFSDLKRCAGELFDVDIVICCLGTTLKKAGSRAAFYQVDYTLCVELAGRARQAGVETFAIVSAVNANPDSVSFYARTKGEMEQALKALEFPRLVIAQPSLLLGKRDERRLLEGIGQALLRPLAPVVCKVLPASTPVEAAQLARALVAASLEPDKTGVVVLRYPELAADGN